MLLLILGAEVLDARAVRLERQGRPGHRRQRRHRPRYRAGAGGGRGQLTKSLAVAWAPHNIQVNTIIPGWIRTDLTAGVKNDPEFYGQILRRTPAGRFGEPQECAGLAVFLASAASGFITGQSIA